MSASPASDASIRHTSSDTAIDRRGFLAGGAALAGAAAIGTAAAAARQDDDATAALPGRTPNTTFAINIEMWFRDRPHDERIRAAAALGFSWVEMWPWRGKDEAKLKAACEETGVRIAQFTAWGFSPGLNDPANHDRFEAEIRESCAFAKRMGIPMATVVAGNDQPGMTQEEMHGHVIDGLRRVKPIVEAERMMLILEPMNIRVDHKGHCLYGSDPAIRICEAVDSPMVKINWDLYHMQITEGDLCRRLRDGWAQVGYVQLADNPGRREPGTGEINYARVFRELKDLGYDKPVGVEAWPSGPPEEAAARLAASDRW